MEQDEDRNSIDGAGEDQKLLRNALSGMTTEQLMNLRKTAHRLKHLPFTRLVEVLFLEAEDWGEGNTEGPGRNLPEHNFAGESTNECHSNFLSDLFMEIERAMDSRTRMNESKAGSDGSDEADNSPENHII